MSEPTPMPEALAQAAEAAEQVQKRQQDSGGGDVAAEVAGSVLEGTLSAVVDGAMAVGEGAVMVAGAMAEDAVNVIGGILGGLGDLG